MVMESFAIVPILIGPLQALLALLPVILAAVGTAILAFFKPQNFVLFLRLLWNQKLPLILAVLLIAGSVWGVRQLGGMGGDGAAAIGTDEDWPAFRGDLGRRGWVAGSPDPTAPGVIWRHALPANTSVFSSPAVAGRYVLVNTAQLSPFNPTGSGQLLCLDSETGGLVWRGDLRDMRATFSSPVVRNGLVASGEGLHQARDSRISLFRASDGGLIWSLRTQSHAESTPVISGARVIGGAGRDGYRAISLEPLAGGQPNLEWHAPGKNYKDACGSAAAHEDRVYVPMGRWGGLGVACLDAETGEEVWRTSTPYPVFSGPTLIPGENLLLVGMGSGNFVQSAEQAMPSELKFLQEQGATDAELEEARKRLGAAGAVWALDLRTGVKRWAINTAEIVLAQVVAGRGSIYFVSRDGIVVRADHAGNELARWNARAQVVASPALAEDHLYVVSGTGILYCLQADTLQPVWEMPLEDAPPVAGDFFFSSPTVAHGRVYVGTPNSGVIAVGSPTLPQPPVWSGRGGPVGASGRLRDLPLPGQVEEEWFVDWSQSGWSVNGEAALHEGFVFLPMTKDAQSGLACWPTTAGESPEPRWFSPTALAPGGTPVTDGNGVAFITGNPGQDDRELIVLDASSGELRWRHPVSRDAVSEVLLATGRIWVADRGLTVFSWNDGRELWRRNDLVPDVSPALQNGRLAVLGKGKLVLVDAETGSSLWQADVPELGAINNMAPFFTGEKNTIIAAGTDAVVAVSEIDGSRLWHRPVVLSDSGRLLLAGTDDLLVWNPGQDLRHLRLSDGEWGNSLGETSVAPLVDRDALYFMGGRGFQRQALAGGQRTGWLRWEEDAWGEPTHPPVADGGGIYFTTNRGLLRANQRSQR